MVVDKSLYIEPGSPANKRRKLVQMPVPVNHCSEAAARSLAVDREAAAVEPTGDDSVR
jgi:hypothetical protein